MLLLVQMRLKVLPQVHLMMMAMRRLVLRVSLIGVLSCASCRQTGWTGHFQMKLHLMNLHAMKLQHLPVLDQMRQ
jgi:hypothetical protein